MQALPPAWYVVKYQLDPPVAVPLSSARAANTFCATLRSKGTRHVSIAMHTHESTSTRLLERIVAGDADAKRHALRALNWHLLDTIDGWGSLWACSICDGSMYEASKCGCCARPDCAVRCGCRCPSEFVRCTTCGDFVCDCACGPESDANEAEPSHRLSDRHCLACEREPSGHCPQCDAAESEECAERVSSCAGADVDDQLDGCEPCSGCGNIEYITELGFCVPCVHERGLKYGDEECIVCGRPGELDAAVWCRSCKRQHATDTETFGDDNDGTVDKPMHDNELTGIEERANAASKGPWASVLGHEGVYLEDGDGNVLARDIAYEADGFFIIEARTIVPMLIAELRAATRKLTACAALTAKWRRQSTDAAAVGSDARSRAFAECADELAGATNE